MSTRPTMMPATATDLRASPDLNEYLNGLVHSWTRTLTALSFTLVPMFFILDTFIIPQELLTRFAVYRAICTLIMVGHYFVLRTTQPGPRSYLHGFFVSFVVGGSVALMTTHLGGFNSTYYAGINLVLFATTILLPWEFRHAVINSLIHIALYVGLNLLIQEEPPVGVYALNNLFFMLSTAVISVSINFVKQLLIKKEFWLRADLKTARDALWGEMELAKQIQTSLLPKVHAVEGYSVAAIMLPADEVGGDYYDIIQTRAGETWISVGDVSGHGVESGLIMMMTQTSIFTTVDRAAGSRPSEVLGVVNAVVKENISRLGTDRYMTLTVGRLSPDKLEFAGKHQDILIYRRRRGTVVAVPTEGTWIGIVDDLAGHNIDGGLTVERGDVLLLFSDGVTEATNEKGEMFGQARLERALAQNANLSADKIVSNLVRAVEAHTFEQNDDVTLLVLKRV